MHCLPILSAVRAREALRSGRNIVRLLPCYRAVMHELRTHARARTQWLARDERTQQVRVRGRTCAASGSSGPLSITFSKLEPAPLIWAM